MSHLSSYLFTSHLSIPGFSFLIIGVNIQVDISPRLRMLCKLKKYFKKYIKTLDFILPKPNLNLALNFKSKRAYNLIIMKLKNNLLFCKEPLVI